MTTTYYTAKVLTGGGATALDFFDGDDLNDDDKAFVTVTDLVYEYRLEATSGAAESSPDVISPDTNAGTKRWLLQSHYISGGAILGDGTAGRVLRVLQLRLEDATDADEIKATVTSIWNGDAIGATDNIGKGETVGNFSLSAGGNQVTIEAAGLTGNCVAVLAAGVTFNDSNSTVEHLFYNASANDIQIGYRADNAGADVDLTAALAAAEIIDARIAYITDA